MNLNNLAKFFSNILGMNVYTIDFPNSYEDYAIKLVNVLGSHRRGDVYTFNIRFLIKSQNVYEIENIAFNILKKLDKLSNKILEGKEFQLVLCRSKSVQPIYVETTEKNELIFSLDFKIIISKL